MTDSSMLAEPLKPWDSSVNSGNVIAGIYMSSPVILSDKALTTECGVFLQSIFPHLGQVPEWPSGTSEQGRSMSQSGHPLKWAISDEVECKAVPE